MSGARNLRSDIANGSPEASRSRRRLARAGLEDAGNTGCAGVSIAFGIRGTGPSPAQPPRSPNGLHPYRRPEPARPALEPNPISLACSRISTVTHPIKLNSTESEADPQILGYPIVLARKFCVPRRVLARCAVAQRPRSAFRARTKTKEKQNGRIQNLHVHRYNTLKYLLFLSNPS